MADRAGHSGDHLAEITNYRAALDLVDEAAAMGDEPIPMIVNGRREMMLSLGEAHAKARQHDEALQVYTGLSNEIAGPGGEIPAGRTERLHYARALRGLIDAGVNARRFATARSALPQLIATGRAMYEHEQVNSYLIRRLAQDMQAEVIFRWVLRMKKAARPSPARRWHCSAAWSKATRTARRRCKAASSGPTARPN